jgi:Ser/Thr protein kinase RdoA (MazF antagonist)
MDQRRVDSRRLNLDLSYLIDEPLKYVKPLFVHRTDDFEYLDSIGGRLKSGIDGLLQKRIPEYGYCHGDHHGANVHQDENGKMVIFDFDCGGYGWRAYDVAVFLWQLTIALGWGRTGKARTTRRWNAFLEGYCSIRPLTENELAATRLFVPIRNIWMLGLRIRLAETMPEVLENGRYVVRNIRFIKQCIEQYEI